MNRYASGEPFYRVASKMLLTAALMGASTANALPPGLVAPAASGFGRSGDDMGAATAVLGDTALVGSPNAALNALVNSGAVQVYRNGASGWEREAVLVPEPAVDAGGFGTEVSLGSNIAAIGTADTVGQTFVFIRDGSSWTQSHVLDYGGHPALSGDTLAVASTTGVRVYVEQGGDWLVQGDFAGDNAALGEIVFGVRLSGDELAFWTGYFDHGTEIDLYLYHRENGAWARDTKLNLGSSALIQPPPSLALSGDSLIASLGFDARVFVRGDGSWPAQQTLDAGVPWNTISSVAIDGDRAVVGCAADTVLGNLNQGSVYVFERTGSTWARVSRPYDANGGWQQDFGSSIALYGDDLLVGAPGTVVDGVRTGSALPIAIGDGTWTAETRLEEGLSHAGEFFGMRLAISGTSMVVGASGAMSDTPGASGVLYVFDAIGSGWIERARIAPPSQQHYGFPASVAIDGDTFAAGSDNDNDGNPDEYGAVYIYRRDGDEWAIEQRISSGALRPSFGDAVALEGELLAVADPGRLNQADPTGRVRTFTRTGSVWAEQSLIQPQESEDGDAFGATLALSGATLVAGAPFATVEIENLAGAAYVFDNAGGSWQQQARLVAPSPLQEMQFGSSVAIAGDTIIVGVSRVSAHDGAFVFVRDGAGWIWQATLGAPSIRTGETTAVALSADGSIAIVGEANFTGLDPGNAFVFRRTGDGWYLDGVLQANTSADYFGAAVTISGTDALIGAPLELSSGTVHVIPVGIDIFADGFD